MDKGLLALGIFLLVTGIFTYSESSSVIVSSTRNLGPGITTTYVRDIPTISLPFMERQMTIQLDVIEGEVDFFLLDAESHEAYESGKKFEFIFGNHNITGRINQDLVVKEDQLNFVLRNDSDALAVTAINVNVRSEFGGVGAIGAILGTLFFYFGLAAKSKPKRKKGR